jgi:uncharacterized protein YuzE
MIQESDQRNAKLSVFAPEVFESIQRALRRESCDFVADALETAEVKSWTYDELVGAGYLYLVQTKPVQAGEIPVARTFTFMVTGGFNIDLRKHGDIYGIELFNQPELFERLLHKAAPERVLAVA